MKNKRRSGNNDLFKSRGFYIALYSCIAVLLVTAVAITYSSLADIAKDETRNIVSESDFDFEDMQITSARASLTSDEIEDENAVSVRLNELPETVKKESEEEQPQANEPADEAKSSEPEVQPEDSDTESPSEALIEDEDTAFVINNIDKSIEELLVDPVFNVYNGEDDMMWPVEGAIVMDYSIDRVIYDQTLDQYRTNDSISIAANVGTQVKASADGVIKSISNSREEGNSIVIEHGNGWYTTYSQLQDGLLVAEGDVVTAGQIIGGVANPSIYSSLLGSHLNFRVARDEGTVNPNMVLNH